MVLWQQNYTETNIAPYDDTNTAYDLQWGAHGGATSLKVTGSIPDTVLGIFH